MRRNTWAECEGEAVEDKELSSTGNVDRIHHLIERVRHCFRKRSVRRRPAGQQAVGQMCINQPPSLLDSIHSATATWTWEALFRCAFFRFTPGSASWRAFVARPKECDTRNG